MTTPMLALIAATTRRTREAFIRKTRRPGEAQEKVLFSLLRAHQQTELGQDLGLAAVKTVEQFCDRIPVQPYQFYEPYLDRIAQGEANVMTPNPVIYLNLTSGSTGKKKLIPVTHVARRVRSHANQLGMGFAFEATRRHKRPIGKMLLTSSTQLLGHTPAGIPYGPVSVGDLRMAGFLHRQVFAHPHDALRPADSLARHYVCLLFALRNPQTGVLGANFPVLGLRLCDYLDHHADALLEDLELGTIAPWLKLEPELRHTLERHLAPAPRRAAQLKAILKAEGRLTPKLAWPNLSFIVTARGGTSNFYFERYPDYFGDTPIFGGLYASAEAVFGIYPDFNTDGTVLSLDNGFYEFIPPDQWEVDQPKTLLAEEVRVGESYRILVTNHNGFYRYDIGDVVEVIGFYNQTPLVTFRHRRGGLLSSTTEKTTEFHATQVMQLLQREFDSSLENFCITLSGDRIPPHYLVNIELPSGYSLDNPQAFIARFDQRLQDIHTSYAVKRRDQVPPPRLRILSPGSFSALRQRLLQKGIPDSHIKFPKVSEDRQFLAGLTIEQEVRMPGDSHELRAHPITK
ncbi:MAG: GH3 auxin-responsive promoter family protein [Elainellaceae cyanobacterium]